MSVAAFFGELGERESAVLTELTGDVSAVEEELEKQMVSRVPKVEQIGMHTLVAGGKRLRPAFLALSARATARPYEVARTRRLGACMEMIHMATLIHDDVIDNAATRRGRETASAIHGAAASVLSGDVLLSRAMSILAQDADLEIIRNVSQSVAEMAEGEVRELSGRHDFDLDESEHLEVLHMKTAAFIESCCEVGAMVAGASVDERHALREYGYHVGMAFQIIDDLLDYRADHEVTGKPRATDFREGCATLPLIYLRPALTEHEGEVARRKFGNGVTDDELMMICDWMRDRGAFDRAQAKAQAHAEEAIGRLEILPDTPARALLQAAAEYVVARES